ncbi:ThiF family adenylyltransferase [Beijerinckia sp. L45]|uniref:ThiF family adenylyltransferase n=1 Tax=Beijerinckia sp. L45 TaxID=1641855 RepID=UPI00131B9505|nr:ThiF family adenylyltransferase [Beijerinckia sp. L45]
MHTTLSLTGFQHAALREHLLPPDGFEAVAIALCGRRAGAERHRLVARAVHLVPHADCTERSVDTVAWPTDIMVPWLQEADRRGLSVVKIHSHRDGLAHFSTMDDETDAALFPCVCSWIDADVPHASVVLLPDGRMFGRAVKADGIFEPIETIMVVGDDLEIWHEDEFTPTETKAALPEFTRRHAQAFGDRTTRRLRRMSAAVIGCSGTGSIVIEQLVRLGIGRLVIVDDDIVKSLNLNRILNATQADAEAEILKVDMTSDAIARVGLGTEVERFATNLADADAVRAVAGCDVVFGCVDTAEGRFMANLLATYYVLPYIDVGVALDADETGAITQVCGYVHYLQPGASSLLSRGAITMAEVTAEALKRQNPEQYTERKKAGYIQNVQEDRPAVISVNAVLAGMAVNELLARLHGFRDEPNGCYGTIGMSISQVAFYPEAETGTPCKILARHVGRGDIVPLLEQAELSEVAA